MAGHVICAPVSHMPFTAAHPAAVIYLQRLPWRLSGIAMVAGSIAPDMEYYLRMRAHDEAGDSLPVQLLIAFLLALAWQWRLRSVCTNLLPSALVHRFGIGKPFPFLPEAVRNPGRYLLSLVVGIFSHWVWDSFTHHDGLAVEMFPVLSGIIIPFEESDIRVYFLLQILSSAFGIAVVCFYRHRKEAGSDVSQLLPTTKKRKWNIRLVFILYWSIAWYLGAQFIPESRFIWDDVFHFLGAGLYALFALGLLVPVIDFFERNSILNAGDGDKKGQT